MDQAAAVKPDRQDIGIREFIGLLSAATALTALAIDTMLPAFGDIREAFGFVAGSTRVSLIVTVFFIGMASGQFLYGPLSDKYGRKRALGVGLAIYALGAVGATLAPNFEVLLLSRLVWGIGSAGPRVVALAILRDRYSGDQMARVMLFVQAVFMIVPILAPLWGQLWLDIGNWRWTFGQAVVLVGLLAIWTTRLPETLAVENRRSMRLREIGSSLGEILSNRQTLGMALAQTLLFGSFFPWLGSSEKIVGDLYGHRELYALVFAGTAMTMGAATLISSRMVSKIGSRLLVRILITTFTALSFCAVVVAMLSDGLPHFGFFVAAVAILTGLETATSPNVGAMSLEPMGHIAGIASSVVGTMNFAGGAFLGYLIDSRIDETVTPLLVGMGVYGALAAVCIFWATYQPTPSDLVEPEFPRPGGS